VATQLCHAVGWALGARLDGLRACALTYFGDGASSEGDFHEACNLAGVKRVPVVFVLVNNQWAISTPRSVQSAGELYRRAEGYGFPGVQVDGNDLLAVYEVAKEAVDRARAGEGPTLIECLTHRQSFHNTTDNPRLYLPEGWLEQAEREDPIRRVEAYLAARGVWDESVRAAVEAEIAEQIEGALEAALALPAAGPADLFDEVYADPPERLRRQREELLGQVGD
jgi:pyruvate dehydrogenase E1 component alpha subunit